MRRLATALVLGSFVLAGCGGSEASSPLDEALGYLPKDAPFAVAVDTDLGDGQYGSLNRVVGRFPFSGQIKQQLLRSIEGSGRVSFERDLRPILGNPFVVGGPSVRSLRGQSDEFVGAIQSKDKGKLDELIEKQKPTEQGEKSGAKLYRARGGDTFAVKEDVLIVAGTRKLLDRALDQREGDERLTEDAFDKAVEGLPKQALLRVYADLGALIKASPQSRDARKVEWIGSLRTMGAAVVARERSLAVDFNVATEGDLSDADLPLASGDQPAQIVQRPGEIGIGLRDLSQVIGFAEAAGQAVNPSGYGQYTAAKRQLDQRLGLNIDDDLIGQLEGDVSVSVAVNGDFGARAELKDPAAFERTLEKVADEAPQILAGSGGGKLEKPRGKDGFYVLRRPGGDPAYFAVRDDVFVLATDPDRAEELASATPAEVPGAKGAFVLNADAEKVAGQILGQLGPQLGIGGALGTGLFTAPLAELNGSVRATKEGLRGSFELSVD